MKKLLIAEDDPTSAYILEQNLLKEGYEVKVTSNGVDAFWEMQHNRYDALLTDWMMPKMDGIELIRKVRALIKPSPIIMVITALSSKEAKSYAIESGADEYLSKPIYPKNVIDILHNCFSIKAQSVKIAEVKPYKPVSIAPFFGVLIGASSGGPLAIKTVFKNLVPTKLAAFYIVLHGPAWMLETFAETLEIETSWNVILATDNCKTEAGNVYIAPGDKHLSIEATNFSLKLDERPPENYVRPAVDPLFRSGARAFGPSCIGVILTGMGCDGSMGAVHISKAGGIVLAQDPSTAIVGSMPERTIATGIVREVVPLSIMGTKITSYLDQLDSK